jgi:hypothetical protein
MAEATKDTPMVAAEKTLADAARLELLYRLTEDPDSMTPAVLNKIKDSANNTVARVEQWDKRKGDAPQDALAALTTRMRQLKGKLKIEVSMDPLEEAIDVTPTEPIELDSGTT